MLRAGTLAIVLIFILSHSAPGSVSSAAFRASALRAFENNPQAALKLSNATPESVAVSRWLNRAEHLYKINALRFDHQNPAYAKLFDTEARVRAGAGLDQKTLNGLVPTTAYWNYLRFRRSLNPTRFDFFHHKFGRMLALDTRIRRMLAESPTSSQLVNFSPGLLSQPIASTSGDNGQPSSTDGGSGGTGQPGSQGGGGGPGTPVVPEPTSVVLMAIGLLCALILVPRARRQHARSASGFSAPR